MTKTIRTFALVLCGSVLALALTQVGAWAQTGKLSPGDQKIVQALFEGQSQSKSGVQPLTRDQIAALKSSQGWGEAFKEMKSRGLLTQKNLGQVISQFEKKHPELAKVDTKAEKAGKPDKLEKTDKPDKLEKPAKPEKPGR